MNQYFGNFEIIRYNNNNMIDIMDRTAILNSIFGDVYAFYPYHVKDGMRADTVAEKYYGDPDLVWLVYFSNNIVDPYHDWPMDEYTFNKFIIDKYGSISAANDTIVDYRVNWFEDTSVITQQQYNNLLPNLKKYWTPQLDLNNIPKGWIRKELNISANATAADGTITLSVPSSELLYWVSVSGMDFEREDNAKKANIRLLDSRLAPIAVANIEKLLAIQ
jgi:hypothetical protein